MVLTRAKRFQGKSTPNDSVGYRCMLSIATVCESGRGDTQNTHAHTHTKTYAPIKYTKIPPVTLLCVTYVDTCKHTQTHVRTHRHKCVSKKHYNIYYNPAAHHLDIAVSYLYLLVKNDTVHQRRKKGEIIPAVQKTVCFFFAIIVTAGVILINFLSINNTKCCSYHAFVDIIGSGPHRFLK